jgi:sortase A
LRRKIGTLLLITAVLAFAFPYLMQMGGQRDEKIHLAKIEKELLYQKQSLLPISQTQSTKDASKKEPPQASSIPSFEEEGVLWGSIQIPKIHLKIPLFVGTSEPLLRKGAGILIGTNYPGDFGNSAIAGHRSHVFGRLFHRLDELSAGDEVTVHTTDGLFVYIVYQTFIAEPTDLSVLNPMPDQKILTLITCHPLYQSSHRLIVQSRIQQR